jgi:hypothetical protein
VLVVVAEVLVQPEEQETQLLVRAELVVLEQHHL